MEKLFPKFEEWLGAQQTRADEIGELARDPNMQHIEHKTSRRKQDEHRNWVEVVITHAKPGFISVFNDAWQEYKLAKETWEDTLN